MQTQANDHRLPKRLYCWMCDTQKRSLLVCSCVLMLAVVSYVQCFPDLLLARQFSWAKLYNIGWLDTATITPPSCFTKKSTVNDSQVGSATLFCVSRCFLWFYIWKTHKTKLIHQYLNQKQSNGETLKKKSLPAFLKHKKVTITLFFFTFSWFIVCNGRDQWLINHNNHIKRNVFLYIHTITPGWGVCSALFLFSPLVLPPPFLFNTSTF